MNKAAKTNFKEGQVQQRNSLIKVVLTTVIKLSLEQIHENKAKVGGP